MRNFDRVAVASGHSVGKSHSVGGIVVWFLHCFQPCIVITMAPSADQVVRQIWGEIRKQCRGANMPLFSGLMPAKPRWNVQPKWFAMGISTDKGERFRGDHCENMLFVFDEANGIPHFAWEEVENMCTQPGNKILAIANPTINTGPFADIFRGETDYHLINASALDHPNVISGRQIIPGAASRQWVEGRIKKLCTPIKKDDFDPKRDFEFPLGSGKYFRPSGIFEARVMGRFPSDDDDTLVPFTSIVYARSNYIPLDDTAEVDVGIDVARRGGDHCVLFARKGPSVIGRVKWTGRDIAQSTGKTIAYLRDLIGSGERIGTVAVDAIGIGGGLADNLRDARDTGQIAIRNVLAVQVSEKANDVEHYYTRRSELAFALGQRFKDNRIDLTRIGDDAKDFEEQAPQVKWDYTRIGQFVVEPKEEYRKRMGYSPDDFDAMELAFIDTVDTFAADYADLVCT